MINLDFEYELAGGRDTPPLLQSLNQRWRHILRLLPEHPAIWGVTPRVVRDCAQDYPDVDVVREVNDKRYSHALEVQLGIQLPYSQVVGSLQELHAAVAACPADWVLKHPFGFSARERAVGKHGKISDSSLGWARRKFAQGWTLLFEPWVEPREDFSMHFSLGRGGSVEYLGHCQLVADASGVYRGNRVVAGEAVDPATLRHGRTVAEIVAARGYWGYLGMDAFTGILEGQRLRRPLVEINARCSFGRLTLALAAWIPPGWSYMWWHPSQADLPRARRYQARLGREPGVYALPAEVDPDMESGTVVAIAPTAEQLKQLESAL